MSASDAQSKTSNYLAVRPITDADRNVTHSKMETVAVYGIYGIGDATRNENTGEAAKRQESSVSGKTERN